MLPEASIYLKQHAGVWFGVGSQDIGSCLVGVQGSSGGGQMVLRFLVSVTLTDGCITWGQFTELYTQNWSTFSTCVRSQ